MGKGWAEVHIGSVARPVQRLVEPVPGVIYRQIGVRLWGQGAYERESMDGGATKYKTLNRVEAGDIIVNKIWARNGSVAVVPDELAGCHGSGEFPTFAADPERLLPRWFHWATRTRWFWQRCDLQSRGTSGKNRIRPDKFLAITIPLPPLSEQRRIVAKIDRLAEKIEEARGLQSTSQAATRVVWRNGASEFLRSISDRFWSPLADAVDIRGGGTPSKKNPAYWGGRIPWISPKDMKQRQIVDSCDHITEAGANALRDQLHSPGAVLVVVRGMILAHTFPTAVLRVRAAINQDMKALKLRDGLLPEYLCAVFWAMNDTILKLVDRSSHDTRKLVTPKLRSLRIPVPDIAEQRRIVAYLDGLQAKADAIKKLQHQTAAELDALLPSILDRAFMGDL